MKAYHYEGAVDGFAPDWAHLLLGLAARHLVLCGEPLREEQIQLTILRDECRWMMAGFRMWGMGPGPDAAVLTYQYLNQVMLEDTGDILVIPFNGLFGVHLSRMVDWLHRMGPGEPPGWMVVENAYPTWRS